MRDAFALSDDSRWYCVIVKPGWVHLVERELYSLGFRTFTPTIRKWSSHARKKRVIYRPVMGRYLFVDIDYPRQSFGAVAQTMGVDRIIANGGRPCPFTTRQVADFLKRQMEGEWDAVAKAPFKPGMPVRIMEGPYNDKLAIITGVKGRKVTVKLDGTRQYATLHDCSVRAA